MGWRDRERGERAKEEHERVAVGLRGDGMAGLPDREWQVGQRMSSVRILLLSSIGFLSLFFLHYVVLFYLSFTLVFLLIYCSIT